MRVITLICDACHQSVAGDDYCTPHIEHAVHSLASDTHYHACCCPECTADEEAVDDAAWNEFLNNERLHEAAESMGL